MNGDGTVTAGQVLFANVEAEDSPRGVGGFQTLAYSRALLPEALLGDIEPRFHLATDSAQYKRCFFTTTSGWAVAVQCTAIPAPDRFGRAGRYLAHALVCPPAAFATLDADPFILFAARHWHSEITPVIAAARSGDLPTVLLTSTPPPGAPVLPAPLLTALALAALRAPDAQREILALIGDPAAVEQALAAVWPLLPRACRAACSFDSAFFGGNPVATPYWAVGLPTAPTNPRYHVLELRTGRDEHPRLPDTPAEMLVTDAIAAGLSPLLAAHREEAYAACAGASAATLPAPLQALLPPPPRSGWGSRLFGKS